MTCLAKNDVTFSLGARRRRTLAVTFSKDLSGRKEHYTHHTATEKLTAAHLHPSTAVVGMINMTGSTSAKTDLSISDRTLQIDMMIFAEFCQISDIV